MKVLQGTAVSPGYASGTAVVYDSSASVETPSYRIGREDVDAEIERFHRALQRSRMELEQLERRVLSELGETYSTIFSAHLSFLHDHQFIEQVHGRVQNDLVNVEQAIDAQVADVARLLGALENEYMRERAQDIRDLGKRLMRQLVRAEIPRGLQLAPHSVIVAGELLPSETIDLDREQVVGIVTERGGVDSHAAILARALGVAAVTGVHDATQQIATGTRVLVDGNAGTVTLAPTKAASADLEMRKTDYETAMGAAVVAEELDSVTLDGVRISLRANLNRIEELAQVDAHHLDGVGLLRTEYLYMDSPAAPTCAQQLGAYEQARDALSGKPLVIRTLDLGADKWPMFLMPRNEANPNLGLRGLRLSLAQPEVLLKPQLRAVLIASARGDVRILFPMVLGESDMAQARRHVEQLAKEMDLPTLPKIGAMIEAPSALFSLKEIVSLADFVSIGTNDLTQLMLAVDRDAANLVKDYSMLHPSVLRAIRKVVRVCAEAGRELSVCGEAAGEEDTARLLVGLGIRQLSMSPVRAARVRFAIRRALVSRLEALAGEVLRADSVATVEKVLQRFRVSP